MGILCRQTTWPAQLSQLQESKVKEPDLQLQRPELGTIPNYPNFARSAKVDNNIIVSPRT